MHTKRAAWLSKPRAKRRKACCLGWHILANPCLRLRKNQVEQSAWSIDLSTVVDFQERCGLSRRLAFFFAANAIRRIGNYIQTIGGNRIAAIETVTVSAAFDSGQCTVDFGK